VATTNHYDALGVSKTATEDEIRAAWKRAAKENHPDRAEGRAARGSTNRTHPGNDAALLASATARFVAAREAYDTLSDPSLRSAYDRELERPRTAWEDARSSGGYYSGTPTADPPSGWQRGDPYPGGPQARPTTRYADAVENPDWWRDLYEPKESQAPYRYAGSARVDFDLHQVDLELGYAERFAFDRTGVATGGRRTRNPFRSMFRNGGKVGG
jgi:curved DNA-binding protein CbpA